MNNKKVLVIIPAYNEELSIKKVINEIKKKNEWVDVLVVNDGSSDKTSEFAKSLNNSTVVLDLPYNLGIGGAVQTGYLYAYNNNYDIAIQIDADGQHDPKYIKEMVESLINQKCDMVIGSRFVNNTSYKQTLMRAIGNKMLSFIIKLFTGRKIYDTTSGYRVVNKDVVKMFAHSYPYDYPEPDTNLQLILNKKKILEVPVEMRKRTTGKSFVSPLKSVQYMTKVILALFIARIRKN